MSLPVHNYLKKVTGVGDINSLYLCHFLSTWNARSYEFATTLFIAKAFPEGLRFVSWSGITTSLSIIIFASTLGRWIDCAPSRLRTLLTSIFVNRAAVIVSCFGWAVLLAQGLSEPPQNEDQATASDDLAKKTPGAKLHLFMFIIVLGVFERLSRVATLLSVERDWVPNLAILEMDNKFLQVPHDLAHLNAIMSRIDLICKLLSPIVVAYLMSSTSSPLFTLWTLVGMNFIAWPLECWTAWKVWSTNASLQELKQTTAQTATMSQNGSVVRGWTSRCLDWVLRVPSQVAEWVLAYAQSLQQYFSVDVWMPSIAITALHFSVLSFSGILTVFLLQSGFSARLIMWGEVFSAVFELSSTFVFAWGVRLLSVQVHEYVALQGADGEPSSSNEDGGVEDLPQAVNQSVGSSKLGMWAVLQMFVVLIPTLPVLWQFSNFGAQDTSQDPDKPSPAWQNHLALTSLVIFFVSASRLGRWTAVLSVQQLAQTCVTPAQRSVFAGTETSFASLFGLGHFVITMIWSTHEEFKWVALLSLGVVAGSTTMYWIWLVKRSPAAQRR